MTERCDWQLGVQHFVTEMGRAQPLTPGARIRSRSATSLACVERSVTEAQRSFDPSILERQVTAQRNLTVELELLKRGGREVQAHAELDFGVTTRGTVRSTHHLHPRTNQFLQCSSFNAIQQCLIRHPGSTTSNETMGGIYDLRFVTAVWSL